MEFEYYVENLPNIGFSMKILPNKHINGELYILSAWLKGDVGGAYQYYIDKLKNFLEISDVEEREITANTFTLLLSKDVSTLKWDGDVGVDDYCTLPTTMLYEILKVWAKEHYQFFHGQDCK